MKQTLIALLCVTVLAAMVVAAAEEASTESPLDVFIAGIWKDYNEAVSDADAYYKKYTAPTLKRYGDFRDKKIISAGDKAIRKLAAEGKGIGVKELVRIRIQQEMQKIRNDLDSQVENAPKVKPTKSVMDACGVTFKGHTYLSINSSANWKEANALCKSMGGHLVYIETTEELAFLAKTFRGGIWVGATDAHKEGDWRWGNRKPVARGLWLQNEPNNTGRREHYAELKSFAGQRVLNDSPLNGRAVGFICEWE